MAKYDAKTTSEFERQYLGYCLVNKENYESTQGILSPTDFNTKDNLLIFQAIEEVYANHKTTDVLKVADNLQGKDQLNRVGGTDSLYLIQAVIVDGEYTENAKNYADEIRERSNCRKLFAISKKIEYLSAESGLNAADVIFQIQNEFNEITGTHSLKHMSATDFMRQEIEDPVWIIEDLLPTGLTVLAGDAKIGKSLMCWNLVLAATSDVGSKALGQFDIPEQITASYFALEDQPSLIQSRIRMMQQGYDPSPNLFILTDLPNRMKLSMAGVSILDNYIKEFGIKLLVIDTWTHVKDTECYSNNETLYHNEYEAMTQIQKLAHRNHMSIVLVTHTNKSKDGNSFNRIQGSMGVQACNDNMIMITEDSSKHILSVKGRRTLSEEYEVEKSDNGVWRVIGEYEARQTELGENPKKILGIVELYNSEGVKYSDIVSKAKALDISESNAKQIIRRLIEKELLTKKESLYFINNTDPDADISF